jgi:uncharacterized protein (DUF1810 family)
MNDYFNLQRFVDAQAPLYERVRIELRIGQKASHWMWFIFPQIAGLGYSAMTQRYAITGREEAVAYANHPVLGPRLLECTGLINDLDGKTIREILGSPDDMKFRSSMTLFGLCVNDSQMFRHALDKYFGGEGDPMTIARL